MKLKITTIKISIINLIIFFSFSFAQNQNYVRKSVSSLDAVWVKPSFANVNSQMLTDFVKFYIEVPRFDFNNIPEKQKSNFISQANSSGDISSKKLSELMEQTIVKDILSILNDPEVKQNRGLALKSESDFNRFAATKAKSLGLTTEELKTLMNSAYIYLPYLSKFDRKIEKSKIKLEISGGIIWWQVRLSPDGQVDVIEVLNATTEAESSLDPDSKDLVTGKPTDFSKYSFNNKDYKTSVYTYDQGDAFLAFAKNLSVKTKQLSDFKLQAQIKSSGGSSFLVNLGRKEGLFRDDGYFIVEMSENSAGELIENKIAFSRVAKTGDNDGNSNNLTKMKKIYGKNGQAGQLIVEHPTLGTDLRLRFGQKDFGNISESSKEYGSAGSYWNFADLIMSYNAAPIVNISQFYFDVMVGYSQYYKPEEFEEALGITFGIGANKKINFNRLNIPVGLMYKYNLLSTEYSEIITNLTFHSVEFRIGAQFMINQDLMLHFGYHIDLFSDALDYEDSYGYDIDYLEEVDENGIGYMDLAKTSYFSIGVDYTLSDFPINIFGFLDPLKKY